MRLSRFEVLRSELTVTQLPTAYCLLPEHAHAFGHGEWCRFLRPANGIFSSPGATAPSWPGCFNTRQRYAACVRIGHQEDSRWRNTVPSVVRNAARRPVRPMIATVAPTAENRPWMLRSEAAIGCGAHSTSSGTKSCAGLTPPSIAALKSLPESDWNTERIDEKV